MKMVQCLNSTQYASICLYIDNFVQSLRLMTTAAEKRAKLRECAYACAATVEWVLEFAKARVLTGVYRNRLAYYYK